MMFQNAKQSWLVEHGLIKGIKIDRAARRDGLSQLMMHASLVQHAKIHRDSTTLPIPQAVEHSRLARTICGEQHEASRLPGEIRDRPGTIGRSGTPCISHRDVEEPRRVQRSEPVDGQNIPLHPWAAVGSQCPST